MLLEDTIEIEAPLDRIWQATIDVEGWPQWAPAMEWIRREDTGDFKVGSTALIKQKQLPETRWTVTEIQSGQFFSWKAKVRSVDMVATHILVPGEDRVTSLLRIEMTGLLITLLGPFAKTLVLNSLRKENLGLKRYCEAGGTTS